MALKQESEKEKLLRHMAISPKKKLEWLYQMHEFVLKAILKKRKRSFGD